MIPFADRKLVQVSWPDITHAVSDWHDSSSLTDLLSRNARVERSGAQDVQQHWLAGARGR